MATRSTVAGVGHLWQVPLLLASVGLFGFAGYLFIDPKAKPTVDQRVDAARDLLKAERPEAAINALNAILLGDRLDRDHEAQVHLLEGQALAALQQQKKVSLKSYHAQTIEQTNLALSMGVRPTYEIERRLGESYEALKQRAKALDAYRQAAAMDPTHTLRLQRKVIELQLATGDAGPAEASLERYEHAADLSDGERAWALCNRAKLRVDAGDFAAGRDLLDRAANLDSDESMRGQVKYFQGYCAAHTGDPVGAEGLLRTARQELKADNPLDADAACLLGQLSADRGDYRAAASFYQDVLTNHPDGPQAPAALLGRGLARLADPTGSGGDAGLFDLKEVTGQVLGGQTAPAFKATVLAGLEAAEATVGRRANCVAEVELLDDQQRLTPKPSAEFYGRLSGVFERRADQVQRTGAAGDRQTAADAARQSKEARDLLVHAADAAVAQARQLTLSDDKGYGQTLWRGVDLYDRAADVPAAIDALRLFVAEKPTDPLAPTALLRLGHAYAADGQYDQAIATYQRNQFLYPNTLAASKSAVPLAQAYEARGPSDYPRAEAVLRGVLEGNPLLTPAAIEYRDALFELGHLYYRTGKYDQAIARLGEYASRYPDDDRFGQALFLTADADRKGANLPAAGTTRPSAEVAAETSAARRDRLEQARVTYDAVIAHYHAVPTKTDLDRQYNRLAHFYRADCLYDTGRYEEAVRQYDAAAFQYHDDPASLAAYVQIVNAYTALGRPDEARAANERAKVMLRQIPPEAFTNGTFAMPKAYWENQLRWNGGGGVY